MSTNPTPVTYTLHNLHGHFTGFQDLIFFLNSTRPVDNFMSFGKIDQILGSKVDIVSVHN